MKHHLKKIALKSQGTRVLMDKHLQTDRLKPMTKKSRYNGFMPFRSESVARILLASLTFAGISSSPTVFAEDAQPAATASSSQEDLDSLLGEISQPSPSDAGESAQSEPAPVETAQPDSPATSEPVLANDSAELDTIKVQMPDPKAEASGSAVPSPPRQLEEIVVTATKRDESVRDIPTTVNVLSGAQLESQGVRQLSDFIDQVPGIKMQDQSGTAPRKIAVRGVGPDDTTNQTVGTVLADIPLGDPYGSYTIVDPDPFDLRTVEVLKGPQGSLFGASSLSGLIRYVPNTPMLEQWGGKVFAQRSSIKEGGSGTTYGAMFNAPIGSTLAVRGSGVIDHAPGFLNFNTPGYMVRNADAYKKWSARAAAFWQPTEKFSINALVMGQAAYGDQFSAVTNDDYVLERNDAPSANPYRRSFKMAAVDARYDFDWATLISLSGYQLKTNQFTQDITYNFSAAPLAEQGLTLVRALRDVKANGFYQELRLASPDSDTWTWLGGAVYSVYSADIDSDVFVPYAAVGTAALTSLLTPLGLGDLAAGVGNENGLTIGRQVLSPVDAKESAIFGEFSRVLGSVKITLGGRLYKTSVDGISKSSGVAATAANQMPVTTAVQAVDGKGFSPKAAITWQATDSILVYSSAARGYQFGGINVVPIPLDPHPETYKSSTLWSYELGMRTDWFENTLRADITAFYLDWKNAQVSQVGSSSASSWVDNVGIVKSQGFESTVQYLFPIDGLSIDISGAYIKAKTSVPFVNSSGNTVASGTEMPNSPKFQGSSTLAYSLPLFDSWQMSSALIYTHTGAAWNNINHDAMLDVRDIFNFNLAFSRMEGNLRPTIGFGVNNITNQIKKVSIGSGPASDDLTRRPVSYSRPRTIDMKLSLDF